MYLLEIFYTTYNFLPIKKKSIGIDNYITHWTTLFAQYLWAYKIFIKRVQRSTSSTLDPPVFSSGKTDARNSYLHEIAAKKWI